MTQPWEFDEPAQGDQFKADDAQNKRLIVVPIEYVPQIRTSRGDVVDGIRINVVDLDNPGGPKTYWGALWFGGKLIQNFKPKIGKMFLGYISKQQTGGGFQAWVFASLTQDQQTVGMAQAWLGANPNFMETCAGDVRMAQANPQQAAQPQQGQQQQQWGQPAGPPPWQQQQPPQQQWGQGHFQQQQQPPSQPQQQWNPATQHGPSPLPPQPPVQQGPPPLPPVTPQDQWPAQSPPVSGPIPMGPGPAQASAPPAPSSPAPPQGGGSVMERLRAQRDQGQTEQTAPSQGEMPF